MNKIERPPTPDGPTETSQLPAEGKGQQAPPAAPAPAAKSGGRRRMLGIVVLLLLAGALGVGVWRHHSLNAQVMATAEQRRDFVPSVRTALVRASGSIMSVSWPATTEAFAQ